MFQVMMEGEKALAGDALSNFGEQMIRREKRVTRCSNFGSVSL